MAASRSWLCALRNTPMEEELLDGSQQTPEISLLVTSGQHGEVSMYPTQYRMKIRASLKDRRAL
jgi:hypothetical protein